VTQDAVEERGLAVGAAEIVGTVKAPNLEKITALQPDFVLLTADISGQLALDESLTALGIAHSYFTADRFEEYVGMMEIFLRLTGKTELREELIEQPEAQIASARAKAQGKAAPTALLMRASSAGVSVRAGDTVAGAILRDLGVKNIAEKYPSLLRELSFETILQEDPDFIFVTTMGTTEKAARANLQTLITKNAAWGSLSAVRENHYFILQKELYHYKPNEQWGVAYAKLAEILYGE
jgi:iron complex transport system substrate-binding protein